jgi:hypothetical protein
MSIGILFFVLGRILFPSYLQELFDGGDRVYAAAIALVVIVVYGVHRRFGGYVVKADSARQYSSSQNSKWMRFVYWLVIISTVAVIWAVFRHKQFGGAS